MLYGEANEHKESAVNVLMDTIQKVQEPEHQGIKMDHWAIRYPTNTEDVGRVCQGKTVQFTFDCPVDRMVTNLYHLLQTSRRNI